MAIKQRFYYERIFRVVRHLNFTLTDEKTIYTIDMTHIYNSKIQKELQNFCSK